MNNLLKLVEEFRRQLQAQNKATKKLVKQSDLSDDELLELIDIYDEWEVGKFVCLGDYCKFDGNLYKVIQEHTTQAEWTPDIAPALYNKVQPEIVIPEFVQPTGAHDAYKKGDKVTFSGQLYESLIDGNTWSPSDYPQSWQAISD